MKIGICLPSRGMVFSKTIQALEEARKDYETKLYISHDLPIPQGHNDLCIKALRDGSEYILFIEEDVVIPAGAIEKLLAVQADIACIDYGVSAWSCVTRDQRAEILWCGAGCLLVKREVFEKMEYPYFRTDKVLRLNDMTWQTLPEEYIKNKAYGGLDIWFCCEARRLGFKIKEVEGEECEHLQLDELGEKGVNQGLHTISARPKIEKRQVL